MIALSPETSPPDRSPGYLVRLVHQLGAAAVERAFLEEGLNLTQWMAMALLHFDIVHTSAELARNLSYDKGAMTRLVDTLEERGWLGRQRAEEDRRRILLTLTPAGKAVAIHGRDKALELWNRWLADWSAEDVDTLIRLLQRLRAAMEKGS